MTYIVSKAQIQGKKMHNVELIFNYVTKRLFVFNQSTSRCVESFFSTFPIQVEKIEGDRFRLKLSNLTVYFDTIQTPQQFIQHTLSTSKLQQIVWNVMQQAINANRTAEQSCTSLLFLYHINSGSLCFAGLSGCMVGQGHMENFFDDHFVYVLLRPYNDEKDQSVEIFIPEGQKVLYTVKRFLVMLKLELIKSGKQVLIQDSDDFESLSQQQQSEQNTDNPKIIVYEHPFRGGKSQADKLFSNFLNQYFQEDQSQDLENAQKSLQTVDETLNLCQPFHQIQDFFAKQNIYELLRKPWLLYLQFGYRISIFHEYLCENSSLSANFKCILSEMSGTALSEVKTIKSVHSNDFPLYIAIKNGKIHRIHASGTQLFHLIMASKGLNKSINFDFLCIDLGNGLELLTVQLQEKIGIESKKMVLHLQNFYRRSEVVGIKDFYEGRWIYRIQTYQVRKELRQMENKQYNSSETDLEKLLTEFTDSQNVTFLIINGQNMSEEPQISQVQTVKYEELSDQTILFVRLLNFNDDGDISDKWYSWHGKNITQSARDFIRKQQIIFGIDQQHSFIQSIETLEFLTLMADFDRIQPRKGLLNLQNGVQQLQSDSKEEKCLLSGLQISDYRNDDLQIIISEDSLEKSQQFEITQPGRLSKVTSFKNGFGYLKIGCNYMLIMNQGTKQEQGIQLKMPLGPISIDLTNKFKIIPWDLITQHLKCVILSIQENIDKFQFYNNALSPNKEEQRVFYIIKEYSQKTIYLKEQFSSQNINIQVPHVIIKPNGYIQLLYVNEADIQTIKDAILTFFNKQSSKEPNIQILREIEDEDNSPESNIQAQQTFQNAIFYIDKKQVLFVTQEDACKQMQRLFMSYDLKESCDKHEKKDISSILPGYPIILLNRKYIISTSNRDSLVSEPILIKYLMQNNIKLLDMQFITTANTSANEKKQMSELLYSTITNAYVGLQRIKSVVIKRQDIGFMYESCKYYYRQKIQAIYDEILRNEDPKVGDQNERFNQYMQLRKDFLDEFQYGNYTHNLYKQWVERYWANSE